MAPGAPGEGAAPAPPPPPPPPLSDLIAARSATTAVAAAPAANQEEQTEDKDDDDDEGDFVGAGARDFNVDDGAGSNAARSAAPAAHAAPDAADDAADSDAAAAKVVEVGDVEDSAVEEGDLVEVEDSIATRSVAAAPAAEEVEEEEEEEEEEEKNDGDDDDEGNVNEAYTHAARDSASSIERATQAQGCRGVEVVACARDVNVDGGAGNIGGGGFDFAARISHLAARISHSIATTATAAADLRTEHAENKAREHAATVITAAVRGWRDRGLVRRQKRDNARALNVMVERCSLTPG